MGVSSGPIEVTDKKFMVSTPSSVLRAYVIALGTIACLSVVAQLAVQKALSGGGASAEVINVAGRQRMLSQRIAKSALGLHVGEVDSTELQRALADFEAAHLMLKSHPAIGDVVASMYVELQPSFDRLRDLAAALLAAESPGEQPAAAMLDAAADFLPRMHAIVNAHQAESDAHLAIIRRLELSILVFTLIVLMLEAAFVFEPMRRSLAAYVRDLEEARNDALEAALAKEEFLATMSHEIRTPLHGVVGMGELLLETRLDEEQRDLAESASRSAATLMTLLNDVLDYAKLSSHEVDLETIPFDLHKWLADTVVPMNNQVNLEAVEIIIEAAEDLPSLAIGDPTRLSQMLTNLVGNAAKFTERGHILVTAGFGVDPRGSEGEGLFLEVADTGIGIASERLEAIFERFEQADSSSTRKYGGTGLGLAIVREIATRMGGWIEARSIVGEGATFAMWVPLKVAAGADLAGAPDLSGKCVWVVDDHPVNRTYVERCLARWGAEARVFEDAESVSAAVEAAEPHPDVMLIDFQMPDMDGVTLARRLEDLSGWGDIPRVLLSSAGVGTPDTEGMKTFQMRVLKPFVPATLARVLGAALVGGGASATAAPENPLCHEGLRVLLVEDNAVNARIGMRFLDSMGCDYRLAEDGSVALKVAQEEDFDLVLMDCQMPVMDGYEAAAALKDRDATRNLPIIAVTANSDLASREKVQASGMDDFLTKPYTRASLHAMLERWKGARAVRV